MAQAKTKILAELKKLSKVDIHVVTCRANQSDLKRRQDYGKKLAASDPRAKKRKETVPEMGELSSFPGLREHLILGCAALVPEVRRLHLPIQLTGEGQNKIGAPKCNLIEYLRILCTS